MIPNIKVVGKYSLIKTFNNSEEFNKYYMKHKEEIDSKTSNQLNKEYKIDGFKITKRNIKVIDGKKQGELYLKPDKKFNEIKNDGIHEEWTKDIEQQIDELKTKINLLTESYGHIIDVLNSLTGITLTEESSSYQQN